MPDEQNDQNAVDTQVPNDYPDAANYGDGFKDAPEATNDPVDPVVSETVDAAVGEAIGDPSTEFFAGPDDKMTLDQLMQTLMGGGPSSHQGQIMEPKDGSIRLNEALKRDFMAMTSGQYSNFAMVAGLLNGKPAALIGTVVGDDGFNLLFASVQASDMVTFGGLDGEAQPMAFLEGDPAILTSQLTPENAEHYALLANGDEVDVGGETYGIMEVINPDDGVYGHVGDPGSEGISGLSRDGGSDEVQSVDENDEAATGE